MDAISYKTLSAKKSTVQKRWFLINAESEVLGRLASKVAKILMGKNKPYYTPHVDCGDNVIIINAEKIKLTGQKMTKRTYVRYTGYPGGQRFTTPEVLLKKAPTRVLEKAIKGMLPKNRLGRKLFRNVFIYAGNEHPHQAQQPKEIKLSTIK